MRRSAVLFACCSVVALLAGPVIAAPAPSSPDTSSAQSPDVRSQAEAKARAIVSQMTLDEKVNQLMNVAPGIPRLGIPAYNWWTESLHGAIGTVPTTNFPEPIGLAASFDPPLVNTVAGTISVEVRALHTLGRQTGHLGKIGTGLDTWSPNINIFRDPRWGRGQETYGEDPFLTAQMGVAFVKGMQGPDPDLPYVVSTPKHFAVHSGPESTRHVADVFVSPHDLEDTYLPAFRAVIVDGKAGSIMCAYNRIDGQPACGSQILLKDHLRGAWGFKGYVVSDCDAVTDISDRHKYATDPAAAVAVALKTGVDNECNTRTLFGDPGLSDRYKEAYTRGLISMDDIDTALVRLFSARYRNGDLAGLRQDAPVPVSAIGTPEHQALALRAATESLVLLKNDGVLPLKPRVRIAVIGPLGDATRVLRGNYSSSLTAPPISILDGLRQAMPDAEITYIPFGASVTDGDPIPHSAFLTPDGKPGLRAEYYNAKVPASGPQPAASAPIDYESKAIVVRDEAGVDARGDELKAVGDRYKVVWTGRLVAPASGTYRIGMSGSDAELMLDGKSISKVAYSEWGNPLTMSNVTLEKGHSYPIQIVAQAHALPRVGLFWKLVSANPEADLKAGIDKADIVVAAVGLTSDLEGEESKLQIDGFSGGDKTSLDLPADQRRMLEEAKALGKPLVVVAMNGSPIDLSWAKDNASAILEAWYPGQAGGLAVGDVLSGKADPGGRLPLTFYHSLSDLPAFDNYTMNGRTYRYFKGTPVYPFGFGLSYTQFSYAPLKVEAVEGAPEKGIHVTTEVANTGARDGEAVAELYLTPPAFDGSPRLALRGVQRIALKAGEHRQVSFDLSPRDLSFVDRDGVRQVMPGHYSLSVGPGQPDAANGAQSTDLTLTQTVNLPQ